MATNPKSSILSKISNKFNSIPAFDLSREGIGMFIAAIDPEKIFRVSRVSRVDESPEQGFQRTLEHHRVKRISEYINDGNLIPGAIILSAQDDKKISFDVATGLLTFPDEEGFFLVIDGQHRLYGSVKSKQDFGVELKIPVCIFTNLSKTDEVQYFIDINGNQKGVSKTLRIELTKFLVAEESIDDIRLRMFDDFNSDPDSPLFGHLTKTRRGVGFISHVPFKNSLDRILAKDPLKKLSYENKKKLINNYLNGVANNLDQIDKKKKLYQAAFFQAIFRVFEKSCESALIYHRKYSEEAFSEVFKFIQNINFDAFTGSNEEAVLGLSKEMALMLDISLTNSNISEDLL